MGEEKKYPSLSDLVTYNVINTAVKANRALPLTQIETHDLSIALPNPRWESRASSFCLLTMLHLLEYFPLSKNI